MTVDLFQTLVARFPAIAGSPLRLGSGRQTPRAFSVRDGQTLMHFAQADERAVTELLASSGYAPVLLRDAAGAEHAVLQLWQSTFVPVEIEEYTAVFAIFPVVPATVPAARRTVADDGSGLAPILTMLDVHDSPVDNLSINKPSLWLQRLFDSTTDAVEFGRRFMSTDKRPGRCEVVSEGDELTFRVLEEPGRIVLHGGVARPRVEDQPAAFAALVAAASHAGISLQPPRSGNLSVFELVSRIAGEGDPRGQRYDWITPSAPLLGLTAQAPTVDERTELGQLLGGLQLTWHRGFLFFPQIIGVLEGIFAPSRVDVVRQRLGIANPHANTYGGAA